MFWRKWILGVNRGKEDGGEKSEERGEGRGKRKRNLCSVARLGGTVQLLTNRPAKV